MKKCKIALLLFLFASMCYCCTIPSHWPNKTEKYFDYRGLSYSELCLQRKTNRVIRKAMIKSDTLYIYGIAFNNWKILWYHTDKHIRSCFISPNKIQWKKPIEAANFSVDSSNISKYFETTLNSSIPCFVEVLDGESIYLIMNGQKKNCSVQTDCLFSTEFPTGSFPYKLKYDLYNVLSNLSFPYFEQGSWVLDPAIP